MSNKVLDKINIIQKELNELEVKKDLPQAQRVIASIVKLLDDSISIDDQNLYQLFTDSDGKIRANHSWFYEDSVMTDRKATYKIHSNNDLNLDLKLYGITKPSKRTIAWAQALTPNFEDEPFNKSFNVGIDFIVPKSADKIIIVLSNNWVIRTLELKGELTVTYQEILSKWAQISDFSKKEEVHNILWESFDIHPLNKKFYAGVSERFTLLRQHLVKEKVFDEKHASLFANRLIGRIIFTWFLDKKGIINPEIGYFDSESYEDDNEYYKEKLERLFFGVLNTPISDREFVDNQTPFLNGGLFEARENDLYKNPKLNFPKNYFDDLFEFLSSYNFTTDESTSQFQQVAIDPEMLGRIFENLLAEMTEETGEQARKAKGTFYTPREIVDYMCRESLKKYLKTKIKEDDNLDQRLYQLIDAPDKDFQDQDHNWRRDWKPYKPDIMKALDELKVLDPACGSGAFPIGMLQLLVKVYERLEARFSSYNTKLGIIENNIYGVDIEPMAVEIARLRTWLSIVVDEESDSRKIKPLPNLEFKFICANSLVELDQNGTAGFVDDPDLQEKIKNIRDSYFKTESLNKKKKLKDEYEKLVYSNQNRLEGFDESNKIKQLKTYRPFDNESTSIFFDSEFMFGVSSFNIVIGNPPYNAKLTESEKKYFKNNYHSVSKGRQDTAAIFVEFAYRNLVDSGINTYIIPYRLFSRKRNHSAFQDFVLNKVSIDEILYLGSYPGFETVNDEFMVTVLGKNKEVDKTDIKIILKPDIENIKYSKTYSIKQSTFIDNNEININYGRFDQDTLRKISKNSKTLDEICYVKDGIVPYIREKLISDKKLDERYVKFSGIAGKYKLEKYFFKSEPMFLCYDIEEAKKFIEDPVELRKVQLRDRKIFEREKIITSQNSSSIKGTIDPDHFFVSNSIHSTYLKEDTKDYKLEFILACLNSKIANYYYDSTRLKGTDLHPQILIGNLKKIPIPVISNSNKAIVDKIVKLVDKVINDRKNNLEIDNEIESIEIFIAELYGLNNDDLKKIYENNNLS